MADYRCPYGYGWCEVPYKDCPYWQGTFCELDVEAEKMDELKPCPFCGGRAQIRYTGNGSGHMGYTSNILMRSKPGFVMCLKCEIMTPRNSRVCRAIDKWNRRAGEEDKHGIETD